MALVAVVALGVVWPTDARAGDLEVGVMAGGAWSMLSQPADPVGDYTFLWGSAFSGFGTVAGPTAMWNVGELKGGSVGLGVDVLHGYQRAQGFADHGDAGRIDVTLTTNVIRVPVLARFRAVGDRWGPTFGLGVEPVIGLASNAHYETTDIDEPIQQVETTPMTTVAAVAAAGLEFRRGDDRIIPVEARLGYNPFVASSTRGRFENFQSADDPGTYRVGFDWQLTVVGGIRWR